MGNEKDKKEDEPKRRGFKGNIEREAHWRKKKETAPEASSITESTDSESPSASSSGFSTTKLSEGYATTKRSEETGKAADKQAWMKKGYEEEELLDPSQIKPGERVRKAIPSVMEIADEMQSRYKKSLENEKKRISNLFENIDLIKHSPTALRKLFKDADNCATKMIDLKMPGGEEFKQATEATMKAYISAGEIRREQYAQSHKADAKGKQYEKSIDLPKLKK
jgi:hypothetical protein